MAKPAKKERRPAGAPAWPADDVQRRKTSELTPYAKNARTHSATQIAEIAASIQQWGWTMPVLVDEAGIIIAGHGRVMAAAELGIDEIPVMVAAGWSDEQRRAYVIFDNKVALNASWDSELLALEISDLKSVGFDLGLTGFSKREIDRNLKSLEVTPAASELSDDLVFRVVVDCRDETHQAEMLERLEREGITCRALIS